MVKQQVKQGKISAKTALNKLIDSGADGKSRTEKWLVNRMILEKEKKEKQGKK